MQNHSKEGREECANSCLDLDLFLDLDLSRRLTGEAERPLGDLDLSLDTDLLLALCGQRFADQHSL